MLSITSSRRRACLRALLSTTVIAAAAQWPAHAAIVMESGDAGQTQATAQVTSVAIGSTTLTDIYGSFSSGLDADLYLIRIVDPVAFSATTFNATGSGLDTQLFLLTAQGAPVEFNDDDAGGLTTLSTLPAGASVRPVTSGLYLLGVSNWGYDPVNANNQLLFANGLSTETRGAATGLSPGVLADFYDDTYGTGSAGIYQIQLTGAAVATPVPEPSTALMMLTAGGLGAGLGAVRRRRRQATAAAAA